MTTGRSFVVTTATTTSARSLPLPRSLHSYLPLALTLRQARPPYHHYCQGRIIYDCGIAKPSIRFFQVGVIVLIWLMRNDSDDWRDVGNDAVNDRGDGDDVGRADNGDNGHLFQFTTPITITTQLRKNTSCCYESRSSRSSSSNRSSSSGSSSGSHAKEMGIRRCLKAVCRGFNKTTL